MEGSTLLGIVGPDGQLGYVTPPMEIDREFVERAHRGRTPESRFRFAEPCAESGCAQWTGERCGLIDEMLATPRQSAGPQPVTILPRCGIRHTCRWFAQRGPAACHICPLVVRTRRIPAADQPTG